MSFKIDAAKLVAERGYSAFEASQRLGVPPRNITRRARQHRQGKLDADHEQAQPTEAGAEPRRLRAELKQVQMENEILKKASAYFGKN